MFPSAWDDLPLAVLRIPSALAVVLFPSVWEVNPLEFVKDPSAWEANPLAVVLLPSAWEANLLAVLVPSSTAHPISGSTRMQPLQQGVIAETLFLYSDFLHLGFHKDSFRFALT